MAGRTPEIRRRKDVGYMDDGGHIWSELLIIFVLIIFNGICSMTEIAIVGARKTKLREMEKKAIKKRATPSRSRKIRKTFFNHPDRHHRHRDSHRYVLRGLPRCAAGGQAERIPALAPYAHGLAMAIVISLVTYATLILGELAPKWLAIAIPEKASCAIAKPMLMFSALCRPLVLFSTWSTKLVIGLIGIDMGKEQPVSEEEIRVLLKQGARLGTFDKAEPILVDRVFQLDDLTAADCMTARTRLDWIDIEDSEADIWKTLEETNHFRLPVGRGSR